MPLAVKLRGTTSSMGYLWENVQPESNHNLITIRQIQTEGHAVKQWLGIMKNIIKEKTLGNCYR